MTNQFISTDMKQVGKLLDVIPDERRAIAQGLYDELVFMQETMTALKKQVQEEGAVTRFENGKQNFLKEHPALTAYNKTIQRYNQVYKQFIDLLPKVDEKSENDPLIDFIAP